MSKRDNEGICNLVCLAFVDLKPMYINNNMKTKTNEGLVIGAETIDIRVYTST